MAAQMHPPQASGAIEMRERPFQALAALPEVVAGIGRALDRGDQVYWVCPMVAESEAVDLAAIAGNQPAMDDFVSVMAGTLSPAEFFDPANITSLLTGAA